MTRLRDSLPSPPRWLDRVWKRRVRGQPDFYRVALELPTATPDGESLLGAVADHVETLRRLSQGRVDVDGVDDVVAETDPVPADAFDRSALDALLKRIEWTYGEAFRLNTVETWWHDDAGLVKSIVVVPVRPLFPPARTASPAR